MKITKTVIQNESVALIKDIALKVEELERGGNRQAAYETMHEVFGVLKMADVMNYILDEPEVLKA